MKTIVYITTNHGILIGLRGLETIDFHPCCRKKKAPLFCPYLLFGRTMIVRKQSDQ